MTTGTLLIYMKCILKTTEIFKVYLYLVNNLTDYSLLSHSYRNRALKLITTYILFTDELWLSLLKHLREYRDKERGRFTRSSLGTGHEIPFLLDNWHSMLLHWSWLGVFRQNDVTVYDLSQFQLSKWLHIGRTVLSSCFYWDVLVLVKVDSCVAVTEQLSAN